MLPGIKLGCPVSLKGEGTNGWLEGKLRVAPFGVLNIWCHHVFQVKRNYALDHIKLLIGSRPNTSFESF